jgi:cell division protein FtsL
MESIEKDKIEALLAGYVLGDLTPEEAELVRQHLILHPELESEVRSLQTTLALLPLSLNEESASLNNAPDKSLRTRILTAAETEPQESQSRVSNSNVLPFQQPRRLSLVNKKQKTWLGIAGSVAAVLVATLGFQNYRLTQQLAAVESNISQQEQQVAALQQQLQASKSDLSSYQQVVNLLNQPSNRFLTVKGTSPQMPASGSLVIVPSKDTALLALQNLPPLPKGKVYRMWAYVDGQKVDCTRFTPDTVGQVTQRIPLKNWGGTTSVIVTIEPEVGITQPTGQQVMSGTVSL